MGEEDSPEDLANEIVDRFGALPDAVQNLLALSHLSRRARRFGIEQLDAGPEALAASFRDNADIRKLSAGLDLAGLGMEWRGERLVWAVPSANAQERRDLARKFLDALAGKKPRREVSRAPPLAVAAE